VSELYAQVTDFICLNIYLPVFPPTSAGLTIILSPCVFLMTPLNRRYAAASGPLVGLTGAGSKAESNASDNLILPPPPTVRLSYEKAVKVRLYPLARGRSFAVMAS
jgi:hypothetical protein